MIAHRIWANLVIIPCSGEGVRAGRAEQRKTREDRGVPETEVTREGYL
jgi:hypothetical protein